MKAVGIWAFTDHDNDVNLFTRVYEVESEDQIDIGMDAYRWYHDMEADEEVTDEMFDLWDGSLCQNGEWETIKIED